MKTRLLIIIGIIAILTTVTVSFFLVYNNSNQTDDKITALEREKSIHEQCATFDGIWDDDYDGCRNITDKQCSAMWGYFVAFNDNCPDHICPSKDMSLCSRDFDFYMRQVEGSEIQLEGAMISVSWSSNQQYSLFTNEPYRVFNTGSSGINLEGISEDDLHGKVVKLSGIRMPRDLGINVNELVILDSLIPKENPRDETVYEVSLDELTSNYEKYYNQTVLVSGQLEEWEHPLGYAGVGCHSARYTTSEKFMPDFPSSRHLYNGDLKMGVRIGSPYDLGQVQESLPLELKNNHVLVEGLFVPNVVVQGSCEHVIHNSGYILTELDKITINDDSYVNENNCAELFDKIFDTWKEHVDKNYGGPGQPTLEPPTVQGLIAGWEGGYEFRDFDCRYTVNDWAYLVEHQDHVWGHVDWPKLESFAKKQN